MPKAAEKTISEPTIGLTSVGSEHAPFIYFDGVMAFGHNHGAIQIELAANTLLPTEDGKARTEVLVTAHLRCSPNAARDLRNSIDNALLLATPAQGQPSAEGSAKPN